MSALIMNTLAQAGYQNITIMEEAGDGVTNANKHFGTLCGDDKKTSKKGGTIRKTLEEHIVTLDINKEEDASM